MRIFGVSRSRPGAEPGQNVAKRLAFQGFTRPRPGRGLLTMTFWRCDQRFELATAGDDLSPNRGLSPFAETLKPQAPDQPCKSEQPCAKHLLTHSPSDLSSPMSIAAQPPTLLAASPRDARRPSSQQLQRLVDPCCPDDPARAHHAKPQPVRRSHHALIVAPLHPQQASRAP